MEDVIGNVTNQVVCESDENVSVFVSEGLLLHNDTIVSIVLH